MKTFEMDSVKCGLEFLGLKSHRERRTGKKAFCIIRTVKHCLIGWKWICILSCQVLKVTRGIRAVYFHCQIECLNSIGSWVFYHSDYFILISPSPFKTQIKFLSFTSVPNLLCSQALSFPSFPLNCTKMHQSWDKSVPLLESRLNAQAKGA